jgi:hypothetical protein
MIGGRNLGAVSDPAVRFTIAIDGVAFQQFDVAPGFFLKVFDIPAARLTGTGPLATFSVQSTPVSGSSAIPTSIEQFDLQDANALMWGYGDGWQEAEFNPTLGAWRWASERATLQMIGPPRAARITMRIESPLRYFDEPALVKVRAGDREIASATIDSTREWTFDVPADAMAASGGAVIIESSKFFVPADRGNGADQRHLGLRVFAIQVLTELTAAETTR